MKHRVLLFQRSPKRRIKTRIARGTRKERRNEAAKTSLHLHLRPPAKIRSIEVGTHREVVQHRVIATAKTVKTTRRNGRIVIRTEAKTGNEKRTGIKVPGIKTRIKTAVGKLKRRIWTPVRMTRFRVMIRLS